MRRDHEDRRRVTAHLRSVDDVERRRCADLGDNWSSTPVGLGRIGNPVVQRFASDPRPCARSAPGAVTKPSSDIVMSRCGHQRGCGHQPRAGGKVVRPTETTEAPLTRHDGRMAGPKEVSAREAEVLAALAGPVQRPDRSAVAHQHPHGGATSPHCYASTASGPPRAGRLATWTRASAPDRSRHELRRPRAGPPKSSPPRKQPARSLLGPEASARPVWPSASRPRSGTTIRTAVQSSTCPGAARVRRRGGRRSTPGRSSPRRPSSTQCSIASSVAGLCSSWTTAST